MKHLKKLAGVLLALVMVMALAAPAFASTATPGSITLKNPPSTPAGKTHTYNVYRVFDMSRANDSNTPDGPVSYTASAALKAEIAADNTVSGYFTFTPASEAGKFTVTPNESYNTDAAKKFSKWLSTHKTNLTQVNASEITLTGPGTAAAGTTTLNVPYGYYFVDSTVGSLFMLDSTTPNADITDKNLDPTVGKESTTPANVKIGDKIDYTITINVVEGSTDYILHDKLGDGLALDADTIAVKVGDADVTNCTITTTGLTDGCAFEISFPASYLESIATQTITVTYKATILNTAAIPDGATVIKLENDARVEYGDDKETTPGHTTDELFQFDLVKTDKDKKLLDTAEFELYSGDDVTTGTDSNGKTTYTLNANVSPIKFAYDETTKTYKVSTEGTTTTIVVHDGKVTVQGLKGTFYLKETKAPEGYNLLTTLIPVEVTANNNATVTNTEWTEGGIRVINNAGTELPDTGGIGTTIFYIVGGVLAVGAVVVLIAKRRTGSDEE